VLGIGITAGGSGVAALSPSQAPDGYTSNHQKGIMQQYLFGIAHEVQHQADIVFTPADVAQDIVEHFAPSGRCLDPCKGDGAFFKHLPAGSDFCELKDDKDFFNWTEQVDWIVSNPPFSILKDWLAHSFEIAENIVYLIPINKPFNSFAMMKAIYAWGGIKEIYIIAQGNKLNFPLGFPVGGVHFQRGYKGETTISFRDV
jgi:hypothetical protein